MPERPPASPESIKEELVLQLFIDGTEMEEFVQGILWGEKLYVPLGELSASLDFPVTVNTSENIAQGWIINEKNTIAVSTGVAVVKGKTYRILPDDIIVKDDDFFIDAALMQKWMPLEFEMDKEGMSLNIATRESLPYMEALLRKKKYATLAKANEPPAPGEYDKILQPYSAAQWPSVDLTVTTAYQSEGRALQTDFSTIAGGEFGYLTVRLFASGNYEQKYAPLNSDNQLATGISNSGILRNDNPGNKIISDLRLTAGRSDYEGNLLGPAGATSFQFGDINAISLSQVSSSGQGRGFTITNRALDRPDNFDVTNFIGDSKPGWDVELYRNDTLIAFQTVGSDGRYAFRNVPILFGNNVFRLALYGPQGQRDEIVKTINADSSLLAKGDFSYNLSVDEKSKSLFGVASISDFDTETESPIDALSSASLLGLADPGPGSIIDDQRKNDKKTSGRMDGVRVMNEFEYGLGKQLTIAAGSALTTINDERHAYVTAGTRSSFLGALMALDGVYDTTDQSYASRVSLTSQLWDTDIQLQQKIANDFLSEANRNSAVAETGVNLSRGLDLGPLGHFDNSVLFTRKEYDSKLTENETNYRISRSILNFNLNNSLRHRSTNVAPSTVDGTATIHKNFNGITVYLQADYDAKPQKQLSRSRLISLFPFTRNINNYTALINDFSKDGLTQMENAVTFNREHYYLSLAARADEEKQYFLGVSINTSLGKIPGEDQWVISGKSLAETGTVAVMPYLDRNYNMQFDEGDEQMPEADIKIGNNVKKTSKKFYALATQLPANLPIEVGMDAQKEMDLYAQNKQMSPNLLTKTYRVVPRPGRIAKVDFPVFETSQLDGVVGGPDGVNVSGLRVNLVNSEGQVIGSTQTAFDGYYLIEGIMPGSYKICIDAQDLEKKSLTQEEKPGLLVNASDFYTRDVAVKAK